MNQVHPLFNTLILDKIFSLLDIPSLKACCLTTKSWYPISSKSLHSKTKVSLIRGRANSARKRKKNDFKSFLEYISEKEVEALPFRNYHIEHWIMNEEREKSLTKFWLKCGPMMKSLELNDVIFYGLSSFRNVILNWTPNLVELRIINSLFYEITSVPNEAFCYEDFDEDIVCYDYYDYVTVKQMKNAKLADNISPNRNLKSFLYEQLGYEEIPVTWTEIFLSFPSLSVIQRNVDVKNDSSFKKTLSKWHLWQELTVGSAADLEKLFNTLCPCKPNNPDTAEAEVANRRPLAVKLTHFEVFSSREHEFKELSKVQLSQLGCLPLRSFRAPINMKHDDKSICQCLNNLLDSLEILKIFGTEVTYASHNRDEGNFFLKSAKKTTFPKMRCLTISLNLMFNCFDLLKAMPNLASLYIWSEDGNFYWEQTMDDLFYVKGLDYPNSATFALKVSLLSCGYAILSTDSFFKISCWFPRLKSLEAALTDQTAGIVFEHMRGLEELIVLERHLTDDGICGKLNPLDQSCSWSGGAFNRECAWIGNLQKLRRLKFRFWKMDKISDSSVYHGFFHLPQLESLVLTKTQISERSLQDLARQTRVCIISYNHDKQWC